MRFAGRNLVCFDRPPSARRWSGAWTLLACAMVCAIGCGSSEVLLDVSGTVRLDEAPLTTGVVSLRAGDGNGTLHQPTGLIDAQGNYRIYTASKAGAPPGKYRVVVFATEPTVDMSKVHPGLPKSLIPQRYNNAHSSPLSFEVDRVAAAGAYDLQLTQAAK
ncbi:hypothetical protein NA78x_001116 [Anatilimnocola sp. NA78]|uniref:hypothetical protein n=1 Tax=Anatilimnocola sp. NA78 TaxID=3415683 RepID=UPI003CE4668D